MIERISKINLAVAVFCILLSIYMLTFNGVASTDDEQLYISLTESLAMGRGYSALQLLGNDRLQGSTSSVEPLHPVIGIPWYFLAEINHIGKAQILFVLPAIYTALTGMLITLIASLQGYQWHVSLFAGLGYGLATIAFPYARMNFREPLAALAITFSVFWLNILKQDDLPDWKRVSSTCLLFLSMGAAALTKLTTAVIFPFFITAFLFNKRNWKKDSYKNPNWILIALAFTSIILIIYFLFLFPSASLNRFSIRFVDYLIYTLPRLPHDHFWQAVAGLLFSPGKGLFMYSPILLISLMKPSIYNRSNWLIYFAPTLALTVTQAIIYNDEWWGITWGTRALLPVLPLVILSTLPTIDNIFSKNKKYLHTILFLTFALSIFIQSGRLVTTDPTYLNWVINRTGSAINDSLQWNLSLSPIFRYWWLGFQDSIPDIAWFYINDINISILMIFIFCNLFCLCSGLFILFLKEQKKRLLAIGLSSCLILTLITPLFAKSDMRYYGNQEIFRIATELICKKASKDDLILIDFYLDPYWWYYSNFGCHEPTWAGLPYAHNTAIQSDVYYPRLEITSELAETWTQLGNVYLVSASQVKDITYQSAFSDQGLQLSRISSDEMRPIEVFQVVNNNY